MLERIDVHATHTYEGYKLRKGRAFPFGASFVPNGVNFSIYSRYATACSLVLFEQGAAEPLVEIPFPEEYHIGNVFTMVVFDLPYENIEYGYRMEGPFEPQNGHHFDRTKILLDPYAKIIGGRDVWGVEPDWNDHFQHRGRFVYDDFDWENDNALEIPLEDLIIYEAHVRGFTQHPTSKVKYPGTFTAIREKIPYLKSLGINCIELMPIFEFDEFENSKISPVTGERLYNYWGYSQVGFFAPKAGFAATGQFGMQVDEVKTLIKELHRSGIEVMLDVVFNHSAEGNENGPTISYRGVDNKTYYMLTPDGYYYNFSGCGNTLNCNNPLVRNMILDCLRYWAEEYHIDGFRFDLASILSRDQNGAPLANPPLLETLAFDPILAKCKLVAEAWDAGGLYQVGSFPAHGRWAEWNGKYRDGIRKFLKGEAGMVGELAQRVQGSPDLYSWEGRGSTASINFIAAHDGFTLHDLFAYNSKHNEANGENNNDGSNDNESWNCGAEGLTDDPEVLSLRRRQIKNAISILLTSQGVPMFIMGDEIGRTQLGSNNTYCQDNQMNWFNWQQAEQETELFRFFQMLIAFRLAHPVLRNGFFLRGEDYMGSGYPDISFHGTSPWKPDWSGDSRVLAFLLDGKHARGGTVQDNYLYVAMNSHWEGHSFGLPQLPDNLQWHVVANTGVAAPQDIWEMGQEPLLSEQTYFMMGPRSVAILIGK